MKHALLKGSMQADELQKSLLFANMSIQGIESERKELQKELALSLETCYPLSSAECIRHMQATAGAPLFGNHSVSSDFEILRLQGHFKS
jgi:hypothetical protein